MHRPVVGHAEAQATNRSSVYPERDGFVVARYHDHDGSVHRPRRKEATARQAALDDLPVQSPPSAEAMGTVAEQLDANQEKIGQFVDMDVVWAMHGRQG
jgi:hypothetical protein